MKNDPLGTKENLNKANSLMNYAIEMGSAALAKLFLEYGLVADAKAIDLAMKQNRQDIIQLLKDKGYEIIPSPRKNPSESKPQPEFVPKKPAI